ncbi:helix-turn-helix domain-containing protein [Streptomyces sp. NPDC056527]|uniref:helix-turn-helix domain-containing protein n=1 Tax=Streptomyces sp. NPDC056527 TaxID=3345853 RepID=UPI00367F1B93
MDTWRFFGQELKAQREAKSLTQGEPGDLVFASRGHFGQFEQGIRKPQLDVSGRIDEVLQTGGIFERTCRRIINASPYASYFEATAESEAVATKIYELAPTLVPGGEGAGPDRRSASLALHYSR